MTDGQVLTLSVAIIVPLSALIYGNSRISDARVALESKMNEMKETLRAEMKAMRTDLESQMQIGFAQISAELKEMRSEMKNALRVHELEHHK